MPDSPVEFRDLKLNKQLLNAIVDLGYSDPSPIQQQAIPKILAGHDVMGIAQTGTGKTAAFVLPILMKVKYAQGMNPRVLILAPTRELVMQISENVEQLSAYCDIRHLAIYGGIGPKTQIETIENGVDLLVATPGRFLDIYLKGHLVTKEIKTFVLDEADKMMDMGFMPQIRKILEVIPRKRQNLLFSATMPDKVVELSHEFLEFPEKVEVAPQATTVEQIEQKLYEVPNFKTKINLLQLILEDESLNRVLIFVKTKKVADNIFKFLERKSSGDVRVIHANKGQNSRINAIEAFKGGEIRTLVATDVAARGIDVSMVSHVINFEVPVIYEDYVHRIGRTGRASHAGVAITFANPAEMYHIQKIEKLIRKPIPKVNLPKELVLESTGKEEAKDIGMQIDIIKRKENPDFKGAFHEKKAKNSRARHFDRNKRKHKKR